MNRKWKKTGIATLISVVLLGFLAAQTMTMENIEKMIVQKYGVPEIDQETFASRTDDAWVVFDTRPEEEFAVGHLEGAVRVDPDISAEAFIAQHGERLSGKKAVFYCSVGYRSSELLARVEHAVAERGAIRAANLRGGIFRWYNEGRPVYNAEGITDQVHPYSEFWGALLIDRR
jgi:rhodanese-related sulfurtransferase